MDTETRPQPDPLGDVYLLSLRKAYQAACDVKIPMDLIPEYIDAAAFFGVRLGKTWDDVMTDAINYSIWVTSGGQFSE